MKKIVKICLVIILVISALLASYFYLSHKKTLKIQTTEGNLITFSVEYALTPEQQRTGLMHRQKLSPKTGMLFLFDPPRIAHMWMKNTHIPLDMIFFNQKRKVIHVHHKALPMDETIISSIRPVAGVLEINAGEAKKYGIRKGSILKLNTLKAE